MNESFMKEQPIGSLFLAMAIPNVISMLVNSLYNIVDTFFIARIGETAVTALSLVFPIQNLINAYAIGFGIGINVTTAFFLGQGKMKLADQTASQGTFLAILHGIVFTLITIPLMPLFLRLFTEDSEVIEYSLTYSRTAFLFAVVIMLSLSYEKIFQAVGRMKTTMAIVIAGAVCNILLDPILIWGLGPFPALGLSGAALATGIGQSLTVALYLLFYLIRPFNVRIRVGMMHPSLSIARRMYGVGIPAALNLALPSLLITCLNAILSTFSQSYVNVLGIYYKLQTFIYLTSSGIVQGMRPLIGYNSGAGEYNRVKEIFRLGLTVIIIIMLIGTLISFLFARQILSLFTTSPQTLRLAVIALRTICTGFIVSGISITCSGAIEGLGYGTRSLVISLMRYLIVIVPLAYLLSRFFQAEGVFLAFPLTELLTAVVSLKLYQSTYNTVIRSHFRDLSSIS